MKRVSLGRQLQAALTLTAIGVLLLAGTGNFVYQAATLRQSLQRQIAVQADMIGANAGAALLFDDSKAADEVLRIAATAPELLRAEIYDANGATVADQRREGRTEIRALRALSRLGVQMEIGVSRPIVYNRKRLGSILLVWDLYPGYRSLGKQASIDLAILFVAVSVATLFGILLQRRLIKPILHLSDLAEHIAVKRDYSHRATKFADDEVGQLADRFNEMLTRVQERDASLEQMVRERTAELMEANAQLTHHAYFDELTGLPNRRLFQDRLQQALRQADRSRTKLAVCFMDLDEFKQINDVHGHETGDQVLRNTAERVSGYIRESDTVARVGGDEFMFLFTGLRQIDEAGTVAEKVLASLNPPLNVSGRLFSVRASLGISIYPDDGSDVATLAKNADMAMYQAKNQGRDRYSFFTQALDEQFARRLEIENDLRQALERNEFEVHYQPQFDLQMRLSGFEALIRWRHPAKGLVSPGAFIPVAEQSGLIARIDEWTLQAVCRQIAEWRRQALRPPAVSVNLSMKLFRRPDLSERIAQIAREAGVAPQWIDFEVTESALMENAEQTVRHLRALRAQGFALAIDDFGTGYSSLNYLKRFPVNSLKIDQSFVRDLDIDKDDAVIIVAIVNLAHSLGLSVIAEGVETETQLRFLREHGCDFVQGYLTGRPAPAETWDGALSGNSTGNPRAA